MATAYLHTLIQQKLKPCQLCQANAWQLDPEIHLLKMPSPWKSAEPKRMRCMILTCGQCGNTHFLNVDILEKQAEQTHPTPGEAPA